MKKLICIAAACLCVAASWARYAAVGPDGWQATVQPPCFGTIAPATGPAHAGKFWLAEVRYTQPSQIPAARLGATVNAPAPVPYTMQAWVRFDRLQSILTLLVTDQDGNTLAQTTLGPDQTGITPGCWTKVSLEADLTGKDVAKANFYFLPAWGRPFSPGYMTAKFPVAIMGPAVYSPVCPEAVANGTLEVWDGAQSGTRTPAAWQGQVQPAAGASFNDRSMQTVPGQPVASAPLSPLSRNNTLRFDARGGQPLTVTVGDVSRTFATAPGRWQTHTMQVKGDIGGKSIIFQSPGSVCIDNVAIDEVFDVDNPMPSVRTLTVTNGNDNGPGSLRNAVTAAASGDRIEFDIPGRAKINLLSPIKLGDKNLTISGDTPQKPQITAAGDFFDFSDAPGGMTVRLDNLILSGDGNPASCNRAIVANDARSEAVTSVIVNNVDIQNMHSTRTHGAVYLNMPGATLYLHNCTFYDCRAANGSAVTVTKGRAQVTGCWFRCNTVTAANGAAVLNNNTSGTPMTVSQCYFYYNTGGATGISGSTTVTDISLCLFVQNQPGGAASCVNVHNPSRGTGGRTVIANCTFADNAGVPVAIDASSSATPCNVHVVNSMFVYNPDGEISLGKGNLAGTHNLLAKECAALENTMVFDDPEKKIFDDVPGFLIPSYYHLRQNSPVLNAGTPSYLADGAEAVPPYDFEGREWYGNPAIGIHNITNNTGVDDIAAPAQSIGIALDATGNTLFVDGDCSALRLTDMQGICRYAGNGRTIDISHLQRGIYILVAQTATGTVSRKFAKP